jgi:hypothetical protein
MLPQSNSFWLNFFAEAILIDSVSYSSTFELKDEPFGDETSSTGLTLPGWITAIKGLTLNLWHGGFSKGPAAYPSLTQVAMHSVTLLPLMNVLDAFFT